MAFIIYYVGGLNGMWKIIFTGVWLFAMSVVDIGSRRVPLWLIGAGVPVVMLSFAQGWTKGGLNPLSLATALAPGILLLIAAGAKKAGYADGIVLILLGLVDKGEGIMGVFFISMLFMSLFVILMLILRKAGKGSRYPYLPFLMIAWAAWRP